MSASATIKQSRNPRRMLRTKIKTIKLFRRLPRKLTIKSSLFRPSMKKRKKDLRVKFKNSNLSSKKKIKLLKLMIKA
jgi:hypothetical protein